MKNGLARAVEALALVAAAGAAAASVAVAASPGEAWALAASGFATGCLFAQMARR